jgi:Lon protease-like protein
VSEDVWIPLFPLGVVLLPGLRLPLHIFEERYKRMIAHCLESGGVFGVVYYTGSEIKRSGCTARIVEVLKRYDDGRLDILTVGEERFRVEEEEEQSEPYLRGRVRPFADRKEELGDEERELALRGLIYLDEIRRLGGEESEGQEAAAREATDLAEISFVLAGSEGFSPEEKQSFLEMTSVGERIRRAAAALEKLAQRRKLTAEIQRIIGGNGHPPALLKEPE